MWWKFHVFADFAEEPLLGIKVGVLWVLLWLSDHFFPRPQIHTSILGRFWHHILDMCPIIREPVFYSRRQCNSKNCKQFYILFSVFIDRIISIRTWPACLPDMNRDNFYLWGTLKDKIYKMYSKNLCTKDNLREKEVKKDSKCSVFHFTSRNLKWMNNEYFR